MVHFVWPPGGGPHRTRSVVLDLDSEVATVFAGADRGSRLMGDYGLARRLFRIRFEWADGHADGELPGIW